VALPGEAGKSYTEEGVGRRSRSSSASLSSSSSSLSVSTDRGDDALSNLVGVFSASSSISTV
jgi:hypothetical protein